MRNGGRRGGRLLFLLREKRRGPTIKSKGVVEGGVIQARAMEAGNQNKTS